MSTFKPEIMAPAGDKPSYLAAVAAGADAIYVGLKHFSARMQAQNFSVSELAQMAELGRKHGVRTYVAMNTLVKPGDVESAARLLDRLNRIVRPDAIIFQDLAFVELARQVGYKGELHLSTLANMSHPAGLELARKLGINRVVLPRELNLDEVKQCAEAAPKNVDLEIFVHGALCHCVSGRCYWSSYLGGKSGLRGRCVQPCRRLYRVGAPRAKDFDKRKGSRTPGDQGKRLFSCRDLSLDVLVKPLHAVEKVKAWKIEGRKKGPHYVYYTTTAYRMLRDNPDAQTRKDATKLLELALGRPTSHSMFLPQRQFTPVVPGEETASGRYIGDLKGSPKGPTLSPREELLPGDLIRIGYEDQPGHRTMPIRRKVPKRGTFTIPKPKRRDIPPLPRGAKVFLVDRREPELSRLIRQLNEELETIPMPQAKESTFQPKMPKPYKPFRSKPKEYSLFRQPPRGLVSGLGAMWLERNVIQKLSQKQIGKVQWWLPPVIWPDEESRYRSVIKEVIKKGATEFVLNAPWQISLFADRKVSLVAGPFCNLTNNMALGILQKHGIDSAIVSPELPQDELATLAKKPPVPLGFVIKGVWPFGISRFLADEIRMDEPLRSPMNEVTWVAKHGQNNWIYPNWELDFTAYRKFLESISIKSFVTMNEIWPKAVPRAKRTSDFNWKLKLL